MGILDNFEKGLERAVNGAFAKTFKSGLQPVEITAALRRELDTKAAVVSRDRILAPNKFSVRMAPDDFQRMRGLGQTLVDELTQLVQQHATAQRYQFAGGISIALTEDRSLTVGMVQIDSTTVKGSVAWTPVLDINGTRYPLVKSRTVIGRGSDADITVDDTGTSRRHVEILWDGSRAKVRDLGSTNGSQLNGSPVKEAVLEPDSTVTIGRTRIVFRVLAQAASADQPGAPGVDDATRRHDMGGFWGPSA
ncbi:MAG: phosphopeptide-binding protein [Microbacteriaceae bacterium]|nr:phosphopeptide-binding protein [Microbacteriaceae bacterium]